MVNKNKSLVNKFCSNNHKYQKKKNIVDKMKEQTDQIKKIHRYQLFHLATANRVADDDVYLILS